MAVIVVRAAMESEASALSALAMRSKAHWGYPAQSLEQWRPDLAITANDICTRPTFVATIDGEAAGFYSIVASSPSWQLDHLWVAPEFMRRGVGRALMAHALRTAAQGGARELTVDADPNAEAFYLQCGAIRRGEVAAPIPGQPARVRPQLAFEALA